MLFFWHKDSHLEMRHTIRFFYNITLFIYLLIDWFIIITIIIYLRRKLRCTTPKDLNFFPAPDPSGRLLYPIVVDNIPKSSTWCRNPLRYNEQKDIENLWVRLQAEFLPSLSACLCAFLTMTVGKVGSLNLVLKLLVARIPPSVAFIDFQYPSFRHGAHGCKDFHLVSQPCTPWRSEAYWQSMHATLGGMLA